MKSQLIAGLLVLAFSLVTGPSAEAEGDQSSEAMLKPGDNLVVEGVPPIPQELVEQVGKYTNFRAADISDWHPVKKEMVINTRFADTVQLHEVTMPGGARTQLTFFSDSARGGDYQPTNGRYCVFSKDKGGNEFFQKWRYEFANLAVELLTDGKSRNTGGVWNNAGDRYAYGSTRRNGKDVDIYVIDPANPKSDKLVAQLEGGGWDALDWSPDDKKILLLNEISINESYLWSLDPTTGEKVNLTPKEKERTEAVYYSGGQFSKDGKGVYTTTDKENEFKRLAYIGLDKLDTQYLATSINWDVQEFKLSFNGKMIAFATNEDGLGVLHLFDTVTNKEVSVPKLPAGSISDLHWHKNNRDLGFVITSAKSPADVYSLDTNSSTVDRWTYSETGGVDTSGFTEPELVHWKSFDGRTISGFLYKPPAKFGGKRPVILNIHGGPESQFRPQFLGKWNYMLNELGCAILFPNIRGSAGYGKTFLKLDNGMRRQDSYKDISALLDWMNGRPDLDANRVMVTGGSYGGHMTLAISTFYSDKIRCALDVVGPSNLVTFLENTQDYRRDLRRVEYGDERNKEMREYLEKIAPSNNADKIKKPLFVVQGKNDPRVPASESMQMVAAVRKIGTPVWFLMASDEGHGFQKKRNSDFQFFSTILFIQKYLLD